MGDCRIGSFAGPVAHHRVQAMGVGEPHCIIGFSEGSHLIGFDEHAICGIHLDALRDTVNLGHKDVVPAEQAAITNLAVELGKGVEVVLKKRIFNIDKIVGVDKFSNVCYLIFC